MKNNIYDIGDKVDYYVRTAFKWHGPTIKRSRLYCHGYIKAIRKGSYYLKVTNAERIDICKERQILGKLDKREKPTNKSNNEQ